MNTENDDPEFSHKVDLGGLPRSGKAFRLVADNVSLERIATRLNVISADAFSCDLHLRASRHEINITGKVTATLIRECVASLEPMEEVIDESFDVEFARSSPDNLRKENEDGEAVYEGEDIPPEIHEGEIFDIGEFAVQQLALAMNPFPRMPGAQSLAEVYGREDNVSPFAVLAEKFKKSDENQ
ncbi:DUF177 domain-containing protein [Hyphococcus flavus]|uniref:DUF177 domain-containing protein n=1 Tax=Hyphococcus flavus TaxID=1866326 RepID=A0AAE9ZGY9_9PROT|nr:DUF177 domain-containing protein [Hyphococcus flavus]WDI30651.1 DUF177 domain-containing protein [Hyphococcus flavus]